MVAAGGGPATNSSTTTYPTAYEAINAAFALAPSPGSVFLAPGEYPIGKSDAIPVGAGWVQVDPRCAVANNFTGTPGAPAGDPGASVTQFSFTANDYPAVGSVLAYVNLATPIATTTYKTIGWFQRPSIDFGPATPTSANTGGPFAFRLCSGTNASGTTVQYPIYHPEQIRISEGQSGWKYLRTPWRSTSGSFAGLNSSLPTSPSTIRSIALVWTGEQVSVFGQVNFNYRITNIIHALVRNSQLIPRANLEMFGAGTSSLLKSCAYLDNPMMVVGNLSNVDFHHFQLDGNLPRQYATDSGPGIFFSQASSPTNRKVHHCWLHHTEGAGVWMYGNNVEVYENWIEDTRNGNVEQGQSAEAGIHVHHNTMKRVSNDGNLWIKGDNGIYEYNYCEGAGGGWVGATISWGSSGTIIRFSDFVLNGGRYGIQASEASQGGQAGAQNITLQGLRVSGYGERGLTTFGGGTTVNNWIVRECLFDGAGGGDYGMLTNGNQFTFINNWTRNNGTRGMQINGSGHSGSGNHTPDGNNSPAGVGFSGTPPTLPSFTTGASWSPYA